jgi:alcohol dehydrogenase, propanol-preferring
MRAMVLDAPQARLRFEERPDPVPRDDELLLEISACGVCRTDLHVVDGELPNPKKPLIPGHEIVGRIVAFGAAVTSFQRGDRVGVPWLAWSCGHCALCRAGKENLCPSALFTGYTRDGGYADRVLADARYCFPLPEQYDDLHVAPLLCAGLIGHRALSQCGPARRIGLYGFGAAAHIIAQVAAAQGRTVFAFTRPADAVAQAFARSLGVDWAGGSDETPPEMLDAAILFAPDGALVPAALAATVPGGVVVCGGIHMSDIPSFPYRLLWQERVLRSVANLTRADARDFLALARTIPLRTEVTPFALEDANAALIALRTGKLRGAAVLHCSGH